jgi:DHA3 family macrolide efflux protein-like MFS transporter
MTLHQAPEQASSGLKGWRSRLGVLTTGDLRLVWLAQLISQLGDGMFTVGIVWLMVKLTGSGLALSGTLIAQLLPYAVLGAVAGALADRWDRRLTMVVSEIVRGVIVGLLPLLDALGLLHAWMIPAVAFLLTAAGQFFDPAKNALVPAIVGEKELVRVNALLSGTRQVLFIVGPAVGGIVMAAVGTMSVFVIDAVSFAASAVILWRMRTSGHIPRPVVVEAARRHLWEDIHEGLRYVWKVPILRLMLTYGTIDNFLLSPLPVIIPLFYVEVLGLNAAGFGSSLSVIFAGFLLGVGYMGVRGQRLHLGWLIIIGMALAGIAAGLFGLGPPLWVLLVLGLIGGAAIGAMEVAESTLLQRESPDELRGRVFALYDSITNGGRAISVALAGGLSEVMGLRLMFYVVGGLTVACAVALAFNREVRRVR